MNTLANPTIPRLDYVAKQYPDWVTMATIKAWTEATGKHGLHDQLTRIFDYGGADALKVIRLLEGRYLRDYGAGDSSEYDRYLPWAAREFNRMLKPYLRQARKRGLPDWPEGFLAGSWVFGTVPDYFYDGSGISRLATSARDDARSLIGAFGSIVAWAKSENQDLNTWGWEDAISQTKGWLDAKQATTEPAEVVYRFPDGWTVQMLTTPEHLEAEGDAMGHCVGSYSIAEGWDEGCVYTDGDERVVIIYSLRDPKGRPHATMEFEVADDQRQEHEGFVSQIRGKQNARPKDEYLRRMIEFRNSHMSPPPYGDVFRTVPIPPGLRVFGDPVLAVFRKPSGPDLVMYASDPHRLYPLRKDKRLVKGYGEEAPKYLEWMAWNETGNASSNSEDEMLKWISQRNIRPEGLQEASLNPRRVTLKRKLMR